MPSFQVLALDPSNRTRCDNALSLLYMIRGFSRLWNAPRILESDLRIEDGNAFIEVREQAEAKLTNQGQPTSASARAYLISLSGDYERIEPLREPLVEFIKDQTFQHRYIIRDEVSEHIACELYPYLYRIENLLRGYLIKFMATRIGPTWWQLTASTEMSDKAKTRKKNELVFGRRPKHPLRLLRGREDRWNETVQTPFPECPRASLRSGFIVFRKPFHSLFFKFGFKRR